MTLFYLAKWFFCARFLGKRKPLQTVLFISNECNLHCRHCHVVDEIKPVSKSYVEIHEELLYSYQCGSRFVDFEGGEPLLWKDNEYSINDLILLAKKIGFFSTTVTTNAQLPFNQCIADSMWVSMDGLSHFHDAIRGKGAFQKLEENLSSISRKKVNINMVINHINHSNVEDTIRYVKEHPKLGAISLNFHTPYPGTEELFLPWDIREKVIDNIIQLKKKGYPILNSVSGLKMMKHNRFKKDCWITNFILPDGTRLTECAGKSQNICAQCGLCMAGEMYSVFHFKPDTLFAGLKLRT